jgi:hypothetical protein
MEGPFIGSEALDAGRVRKHQLRSLSRYRAIFPGVYISADLDLTFARRVEAAWLWFGAAGGRHRPDGSAAVWRQVD